MRKVVLGTLAVVAALVAWIALQPSEFRVEREARIEAPADFVMAQLEDFRRWSAWSPWERLDPDMKREYGGANAGVGATYRWAGNDDVGEGRMTIVALEPLRRLTIRLEFGAPMAATNETTFTLEPEGAATRVEWAMTGQRDWIGRIAGLLFDAEGAIGADFEAGLANLAQVCEPLAAQWREDMLRGAGDAAAQESAAAEAAVLRIGPEHPQATSP